MVRSWTLYSQALGEDEHTPAAPAVKVASPRDLWGRIKAGETEGGYPLKTDGLEFGRWTLVFDIGDRAALPVAVRAAASRS